MDSPIYRHNGHAAQMQWGAPGSPVSQMMSPSFDTAKNADWGGPPFFSFSQGQNSMHTKPQWSTNRRQQHQTKLPAKLNAEAQWQFPADNSSTGGYQQPHSPCAVELQGLPHALCQQNFLEAILDQAGLADSSYNCVLGQEQNTGKALICFTNQSAAQMCVDHFTGCCWDKSGGTVSAQIVELQHSMGRDVTSAVGRSHLDKAPGGKVRKSRSKVSNEAFGNVLQPYAVPFDMATKNPYQFNGFEQSYFVAPTSGHRDESPNEGSQGSTMASPHPSDQTDDIFACDTDDGF